YYPHWLDQTTTTMMISYLSWPFGSHGRATYKHATSYINGLIAMLRLVTKRAQRRSFNLMGSRDCSIAPSYSARSRLHQMTYGCTTTYLNQPRSSLTQQRWHQQSNVQAHQVWA